MDRQTDRQTDRQHFLFVYGNSGLGKSLIYLLESNPKINIWDEIVFINDFEQKEILGYKTISFEDSLQLNQLNNRDYIIALGEPFFRSLLYKKCQHHNLKMVTINGSQYPIFRTTTIKKGCLIHFGSIIDADAIISENTFINKNVIVGMGSVVTKDIPDNQVVVGNPARFIRYNETKRVFKS